MSKWLHSHVLEISTLYIGSSEISMLQITALQVTVLRKRNGNFIIATQRALNAALCDKVYNFILEFTVK